MYLLLERCEGGELFVRLQDKHHYDENGARTIGIRVAETLQYLHSLGIMHRDLKPENILLLSKDDDLDIKLCDFGMCKMFKSPSASSAYALEPSNDVRTEDNSAERQEGELPPPPPPPPPAGSLSLMKTMTVVGTPACVFCVRVFHRQFLRLHPSPFASPFRSWHSRRYFAPEVALRRPYSFAADFFSLGVMLHALLVGYLPRPSNQLSGAALQEPPPLSGPGWELISDEAKDVVRGLLHPDPERRLNANQFLEHPWIVRGTIPDAPLLLRAQSSLPEVSREWKEAGAEDGEEGEEGVGERAWSYATDGRSEPGNSPVLSGRAGAGGEGGGGEDAWGGQLE